MLSSGTTARAHVPVCSLLVCALGLGTPRWPSSSSAWPTLGVGASPTAGCHPHVAAVRRLGSSTAAAGRTAGRAWRDGSGTLLVLARVGGESSSVVPMAFVTIRLRS